MTSASHVTRRALLIEQSADHPVYLFALTAEELARIADVSRVARNDANELIGYQRPEVKRHIQNIVDYLSSETPILPNAIILALSSTVRFTKSRGPNVDDGIAAAGTIEIPFPGENEQRPAFIVDGQQRMAALAQLKNQAFPIPVAAFVADTVDVQRDQFVRINSAKPLPSGLVTELLPQISTPISPRLATRRLPSALVDLLNTDDDSPFKGMIKRASQDSASRKAAVVADKSLVDAIEEALRNSSSCLYPYRNLTTGETDIDGIWAMLLCYWSAVRDVFPDAWGLPPTKSRLMHGVGIRSMSRLMDRVMASIDPLSKHAQKEARTELSRIKPSCAWTSGTWTELNNLEWNHLENTTKDIKALSNFLIRAYLQSRSAR
jgi:DGQHR domain-containing protein